MILFRHREMLGVATLDLGGEILLLIASTVSKDPAPFEDARSHAVAP